jgi:hypothetical protein
MSRTGLKFSAAILSASIVTVLFAGLDNLPRSVRNQIDGERAALAAARDQARAARNAVEARIAADPALFAAIPASRQWPQKFGEADGGLQSAGRDMDELARLEKQNRRQDRARAESLLTEERGLRTGATAEAEGVQKEAERWLDLQRNLPQTLQDMQRNDEAIRGFDLNSITAAVQKAETDWPEKQADLEARLAAVRNAAAESEQSWDASAAARQQAAAGGLAGADLGALLVAADQLQSCAANLPQQAADLKALSAQLYDSWDKLLIDMEARGIGASKEYDQEIRTVRTHFESVSATEGATTSEDRWIAVPQPAYQAMEKDLGMAIEHKPAGKYDFESERIAQPAGFAYMASPSQGSNQYGYWERRDGRDFWVFYGQYALLRDLLFGHDYRPLERGEWDGYQTSRSRGQTYYGGEGAGQKYGTSGSATEERYAGSSYARSGGFKNSQYASKSGSFRNSPYASPGAREGESAAPKSFGRNSSPKSFSPPSVRSFRPAPAPKTFRMPSMPRRFGRH